MPEYAFRAFQNHGLPFQLTRKIPAFVGFDFCWISVLLCGYTGKEVVG